MKKYFTLSLVFVVHQLVFGQAQQQYVIQPSSVTGIEAIIFNRSDLVNSTIPGARYLVAGSWTWNSASGTYRSLLRFDLSGVPSSVIIDSVKLNLTVDSLYSLNPGVGYGHNSHTESNISTLKKVTSAWTPGVVTWNSQPTTSTQDSVIINQSTSNFQNYSLNVTSIVNQWLANPSSNYGFLLKNLTENYYNTLVFCSSLHSKPSNRPKLTIFYRAIPTAADAPDNSLGAVKLYPVPASNQITIESSNLEKLEYQIYNSQGASVAQGISLTKKTEVNISSLSPGLYVVEIKNSNGEKYKLQQIVVE